MKDLISCSETDLAGNITYVSSDFFLATGYSKEELQGQSHRLMRDYDVPSELYQNLWQTISSGESWFGVLKNKKQNGESEWVYSFVFPVLLHDQIIAYRSIRMPVFDPSVIAQTEVLYLRLRDKDPEISLLRGKIYTNLSFHGTVEERVKGLIDYMQQICVVDLSLFYNALQGDNVDKIIMAFLSRLANIVFEVSVAIDSINNMSMLEINKSISAGLLEGTLIGRLNQAIYEQQHRFIAQSRHSVMGEMIAMISHQWRQPLAVLRLNTDIISKKVNMLDIPEKDKTFLNGRTTIVQEMLQEQSLLIADFSDFFKIDKDNDVFYVAKSVDLALFLLQSSLLNSGITVNKNIDPNICLFGLEREFRQVIVNIVKNAIDQLVEHKISAPVISIDVHLQDNIVEIQIGDNGGGIPEKFLSKIFEAYVSSKSLNGTGLGLYMVKMIVVDNFKGDIRAFNSGSGAVFCIHIPVSPEVQ